MKVLRVAGWSLALLVWTFCGGIAFREGDFAILTLSLAIALYCAQSVAILLLEERPE